MYKKLPALSTKAMVSAGHSLITSTGLNILKNGGNAMDASVAMSLTASVVFPDMCGLGGDGFLLYYEKKTKKVYALNGSGHAPIAHTPAYFREKELTKIPHTGALSVSVGGLVDFLFKGLELFGSKPFSDLIADSVQLARDGVPTSYRTRSSIEKTRDFIEKNQELKNYLLNDDGSVRSILKNPKLANLLENLAKEGRDYYYKKAAHSFCKQLNELGAQFTVDDFDYFQAEVTKPLQLHYRDKYHVYQSPLVSQGIIMLEMMGILEQADLQTTTPADWIHLLVEANKLAFEDRLKKLEDPQFQSQDVADLLKKDYLKSQYEKIDMDHKMTIQFEGQDHHTTSFCVVDTEGNAVSFISSISEIFGSGIMDKDYGVIFNNRAGNNFHLNENYPNSIAGRKRTLSTLITYLVTDNDGNLMLLGNTPGGDNQPIWNTQNLLNVLDHDMDAQTAMNQIKFYDAQTSNPFNKDIENILFIEEGIEPAAVKQLQAKGHIVRLIPKASGSSQMIQRVDDYWLGASDPRTEASAGGI